MSFDGMTSLARTPLQEDYREAVQQAILGAALELFVENGYEQVSIRNIAAKVGYSPGAIYSYFRSKDDIFFALAEKGLRWLTEGDPANTPSDDALGDLRATARRFYAFSQEQPEIFALIYLDRRVPKISSEYGRLRFMKDVWQKLESRVTRCVAEGYFPETLRPAVAIRLLMSPILGIAAQRISNRLAPDEDVDALVDDMIDVTVAGLRAGAQTRARGPRRSPYEVVDRAPI
jgi:AcrR family transcriptional regulator